MNNKIPHFDINSQKACDVDGNVMRFVHHWPQRSLWNLSGRGITHNICMTGVPGDHIYKTIKQSGDFYEADVLKTIYHWVNGSLGLVIDVGANIGNHTVFFAKVLGASVISVEPSSCAIEFLRANIKLNCIEEKVRVVECAAGDRMGTVALVEAPPTNIGASYTVENRSDYGNHDIVQMRTLDDMVDELCTDKSPDVSLIKIDVEGFEQRVLKGAARTVQKHTPVIVIEVHTTESLLWTKKILSRYGYGAPVKLRASSPTYLFDRGFRRMRKTSLYRMKHIYSKVRKCISALS